MYCLLLRQIGNFLGHYLAGSCSLVGQKENSCLSDIIYILTFNLLPPTMISIGSCAFTLNRTALQRSCMHQPMVTSQLRSSFLKQAQTKKFCALTYQIRYHLRIDHTTLCLLSQQKCYSLGVVHIGDTQWTHRHRETPFRSRRKCVC